MSSSTTNEQHTLVPPPQIKLSKSSHHLINLLLCDFFNHNPKQQQLLEKLLVNVFKISLNCLHHFITTNIQDNNNNSNNDFIEELSNESAESLESLVRSSMKIYLLFEQAKVVNNNNTTNSSTNSSTTTTNNNCINFSFLDEITKVTLYSLKNDQHDEYKKKAMSIIPILIMSEYCNHFNHAKQIEQFFNYCMDGSNSDSNNSESNNNNNSFINILRLCCSEFKIRALELLKTVRSVFSSKKVSKIEDSFTCGRILLFVASVLPYNHDACINKGGHFNKEHHSLLEQQILLNSSDPNTDNNTNTNTTTQALNHRDDDFENYWYLQVHIIQILEIQSSLSSFYNQYPRGNDECPNWIVFSRQVERILKCLDTRFTTNIQTMKQLKKNNQSSNQSSVTSHQHQILDGESLFYLSPIKLLKNRKLFDLQLDDIRFRRQVLIQLLITMYRLIEKNSEPSFYANELLSLKDKTLNVLRKYDPESISILETILERERYWSNWKSQGCTPFFNNHESIVPQSTRVDQSFKNTEMAKFLASDSSQTSIDTFLRSSDNILRSYNFKDYIAPCVKEEIHHSFSEKMVNSSVVFVWKSCRLLAEFDIKYLSLALEDLKKDSATVKKSPHFLETISLQVCPQVEEEEGNTNNDNEKSEEQEQEDNVSGEIDEENPKKRKSSPSTTNNESKKAKTNDGDEQQQQQYEN